MKHQPYSKLKDSDLNQVVMGIHPGKYGACRDIHTSKTCRITVTVQQKDATRFQTLAKNIRIQKEHNHA
jgi:ribosomal protein S4E